MADLLAVKDYIARHQLEDELSHAVNLAIKANSEDPFRLIGEYLLEKAKPKDDDEDEDEDIMMEEEEAALPVMKPRGRREQVMAAAFEVPTDWKPPEYPKDKAEEEFLKSTMADNRLMKSLNPSDRKQLMQAFRKVEFADGVEIIKQGDPGDLFYILASGTCDISIAGKGTVMKAQKGIAFGELALLHNAPRAATVRAEGAVTAWALDMVSFKMILMGKAQQDAQDYVSFLDTVDMLAPLSKTDKQTVASALKEIDYEPGRLIIGEGEEGDRFYIIRSGEVKCTKVGHAEEVSRRLKRGDCFGELALLSSDKRAATVTAVGSEPTTVLALDRATFTRLLGPLSSYVTSEAEKTRVGTPSN